MSELEQKITHPLQDLPSMLMLFSVIGQAETAQQQTPSSPDGGGNKTSQEKNQEIETANTVEGAQTNPTKIDTAEYKPIPDRGDKLIMVLNFLMREVVPLKSREAQKQLLVYYFKAILSESIFSPFTSLAYSITTNSDGGIELHDDIYQIRPDVLTVCQSAVNHAQNETERQRFQLELLQFQALIDQLHALLTSGYPPHAILEKISNLQQQDFAKTEAQLFDAFGWTPTENLISVEAARKLNLPPTKHQCYAGKKVVYIMPQSMIHEGNMSVVAVTQPVYIPAIKKFVLLHDQSFFSSDWKDHFKTLNKLGVPIDQRLYTIAKKQHHTANEKKQLEEYVMSHVVVLHDQQTIPAKNTLTRLLDKQSIIVRAKEWWKKARIMRMNSSLERYAELVLLVLEKENVNSSFSPKKVRSLTQFMKRIVLAGILTESHLSEGQVESMVRLYTEHGHKSEQAFAETAAFGFNFGAAIKSIDTSLLECVSIGTIQGFGLNKVIAQLNDNPFLVSRDALAQVIGAERAQKWHRNQTCIQCGLITWVGECGLCLSCETATQVQTAHQSKKNQVPKPKTKITDKTSLRNEEVITVGSFVANLI